MCRHTMSFEVGRRADDEPTDVSRQSLSNHVLRHGATITNSRIEATFDDVDHAIADRNFDLHVWIAFEKGRDYWAEEESCGLRRHTELHAAHRSHHGIGSLRQRRDRSLRYGPTTAACNASPAAVSVTLRVVRLSSRTPRRSSNPRSAWLSADALIPSSTPAFLEVPMLRQLQKIREVRQIRSAKLHPRLLTEAVSGCILADESRTRSVVPSTAIGGGPF